MNPVRRCALVILVIAAALPGTSAEEAVSRAAIDNMLTDMEKNRDVWLGWTWWAAGSRWGDYLFSIEPKADGSERPQMAWLRPHLKGACAHGK